MPSKFLEKPLVFKLLSFFFLVLLLSLNRFNKDNLDVSVKMFFFRGSTINLPDVGTRIESTNDENDTRDYLNCISRIVLKNNIQYLYAKTDK